MAARLTGMELTALLMAANEVLAGDGFKGVRDGARERYLEDLRQAVAKLEQRLAGMAE